MNIPFNQIYNFINATLKDNKVIYRFEPSGSKNLESLSELVCHDLDFNSDMDRIVVVMHDQEPLCFDNFNCNVLRKSLPQWMDTHSGDWKQVLDIPNIANILYDLNLNFIRYGLTPYDRNILVHSELNSPQCEKYQTHGFETVYWWSHAMIARDWYRYAFHDPNLVYQFDFDFDFNVYNRAWSGSREYRLVFSDLILEHDLLSCSQIKFSQHDGYHYLDHEFTNKEFKVKNNLEQIPNNRSSSCSSADYNATDYSRSAIDIVLETLFDDERVHLTEKTLRPIACGKPFILSSTPHSLKVIRNYGFQTFDTIWDESYDNETDSLRRMFKIIQLMKSIKNLPSGKKLKMFKQAHDIAQYNKNHFFSNNFSSMIINELKNNYWTAKAKCESFKLNHGINQIKQHACHVPKLKEIYDCLRQTTPFQS